MQHLNASYSIFRGGLKIYYLCTSSLFYYHFFIVTIQKASSTNYEAFFLCQTFLTITAANTVLAYHYLVRSFGTQELVFLMFLCTFRVPLLGGSFKVRYFYQKIFIYEYLFTTRGINKTQYF